MSARPDDRIYWVPADRRLTFYAVPDDKPTLWHSCPTAVAGSQATREQLDPMALGTCRYCGERLPMSPDKETEQSALSS